MAKGNISVFLLFFIISFNTLVTLSNVSAADQPPKNVLLLTSYHQGDRWNDSVVEGIRETLESHDYVRLSIEDLDMRRYTGPDHTKMIKEYIRAKYQSRPQDLILVSDDPALTVLLNVREELFPGVPVVFCGINNFNQNRILGQTNITGVNEALSLDTTLELALKLFPKTTRIMAVVSDTDPNGRTNLEHYRAVADRMKGRVQFGELLNMTEKEAPAILRRLPKDCLILRLISILKPEGGYLSIEDSIRMIATHAPVPVFSPWSFDLGDGALGGYVSSGRDQGRVAGNLAISILKGQGAEQIPVVMESPNVSMFDYNFMERFGIKESDLPEGSVVLNLQVSMLEQYWGWLLGIAMVCCLQMLLILALSNRGRRLHTANAALRESEHFNRSLLEAIPVPVFYKGRDGRYQGFNKAFLSFYGKSADELIGKSVFDITSPDMAKVYHAKDTELLENPGIQIYPYKVSTSHGDFRDVIFHKASFTDERGSVIGLIGAILDVTEQKQNSMALQESELRYKTLHNASFGGISIHDQGIILDCNRGLSDITGYSYEELIGMNGLLLIAEQSRELVTANISAGCEKPYEAYGLRKNGEVYPLLLEGRNIPYQGCEARVVEFRDITERKKAEAALRESEERFLLAMKASNDGLFDWNLETNEIYYSPAWKKILGYEDHELPNDFSIWERNTDAEDVKKSWELQQKLITKQIDRFVLEFKMRHKDGHWVDILSRAEAIFNDSGKAVRIVGTHTDISGRKWAEEELRASEQQHRLLVQNLHAGVVVHAPDTKIILANEQACKLLGLSLDQMMGKTAIDPDWRFVREDETVIPFEEYPVNQIIATRQPVYGLVIGVDRPAIGDRVWILANAFPELDAKGLLRQAVVTFVDITERKQAEAEREKLQAQLLQAQKLEAIGTLAGGIAHDFNNILGAIVGYSEMVRDDFPPGTPGIHDINQVLKASHRAKDLVKQILAFSRQVEDQKIPLQLAVIVKEAITLLRSSLPTTISIKQDIDAESGMVLADPTQMHQIAMNLATNAFHAMEAKGGTLTISVKKKILSQDDLVIEPDLQPGTFVQLSVRDTGEGILPEIRERIFDPFFTTKEVGKGTGLGLSMVYSIVRSCHGSITCDSRVGEGTEFRILLPTLEGHAIEENESTTLIPHGKEHILFIDDEEMLVEVGQSILKRLGYHVTTRTNSIDALTTFQNHPDAFDLLITDQTMPGMTGVDLARRILQIRPEMPIILCTGYSSLISEDKAKAAGIRGFAHKPMTKKDVGELIRKILDGKIS